MAKVLNPLDKPSRRTVEQLFHDLIRGRLLHEHSRAYQEYQEANQEEGEFEEKLKDNPILKKLKAKRNRAYSRYHKTEREFSRRAIELKMEYQANGLTPKVLKGISKLIEDIKSCS